MDGFQGLSLWREVQEGRALLAKLRGQAGAKNGIGGPSSVLMNFNFTG